MKLGQKKPIYNAYFCCIKCKRILAHYNTNNPVKISKGYVTICFDCWKDLEELKKELGRVEK